MGDAHEVIIDDVGKVIGGQAVPFQEHLVIQGAVFHGDVAENSVMKGGGAVRGDLLADDVWLTGLYPAQGFLQRQVTAGISGTAKVTAVLLRLSLFTEAIVCSAFFHQQPGILPVGVPALGLDIGGHRTAHIGALVVGEAALGHGTVDYIHRTLHLTVLVGVLNAQDEGAAVRAGDEPGIQGCAQIAYVHIPCGRGGKPGAHLAVGNLGLHLLKIAVIQFHGDQPPQISHIYP